MNTTLLFVELLIIGLEGWIWIFLFTSPLFPIKNYPNMLLIFKDWELVIIAIFLALTYVLGVIIDRIADWRVRPLEKKHRADIITDNTTPISVMRFSLGTQNDFLNQQLDYTRSRLRIMRASILNIIAITIALCFYLWKTYSFASTNYMMLTFGIVILAGTIVVYLSHRTLVSLIKAHLNLIQNMYEYQNKPIIKKSKRNKKTLKDSRTL
ncbi:MAG: hypothetical protein JNJ43_10495 [Anaerolineales bacterium]|nr:hypothetical protein [Anaerolineales bacterium]